MTLKKKWFEVTNSQIVKATKLKFNFFIYVCEHMWICTYILIDNLMKKKLVRIRTEYTYVNKKKNLIG